MAFSKPTHITKVTYSVKKTGKTFETTLGSTFATVFQGADKFTGKTLFIVTIDGQQFMVPVSLSAKPVKTEKGDSMIIHVNQTDTIEFVSTREVPIAELAKAPAAPSAPAAAPAVRGLNGSIARTPAPAAGKIRTL